MTRDSRLPSDRSFGQTFAAAFLIGGIFFVYFGNFFAGITFVSLSLTTITLAFARPSWLNPFNRLWMKFGEILHMLISPMVLGAMYFIMFAPVGIATRIAGRDALRLKMDKHLDSYWIERNPPGPESGSLQRQY